MNYNLNNFPISPATDSRTLFQSLGFFWKRIFKDRAALTGLCQGVTTGAEQNYTDMQDSVASYAAATVPIFNSVNWYSLTINKSDLNQGLLYGEDVLFGATVAGESYIYGDKIPGNTDVYSVLVPEELQSISLVADAIIDPSRVWVSGQNVVLKNRRLSFKGYPFKTGENILKLWFYKAQLDTDNLWENIGYMFGLHLDNSENSKNILSSMVNLLANGATIDNLETVCAACLNLSDASDRVNIVDSVAKPNWWQTDLLVSPNSIDCNLPLSLPPTMFLAGYMQMLQFDNSAEPIYLLNDQVVFPVIGEPKDVELFNKQLNSDPTIISKLNSYLGVSLSDGPATINPVDFIFKSVLGHATTLIHVKFNNTNELSLFAKVFNALKNNIPQHVWLLFVCEVNTPTEHYQFDNNNTFESVDSSAYPLTDSALSENVYLTDANGSSGLLIKDMVLRRTIPADAHSWDYNNLSFTIPAV